LELNYRAYAMRLAINPCKLSLHDQSLAGQTAAVMPARSNTRTHQNPPMEADRAIEEEEY